MSKPIVAIVGVSARQGRSAAEALLKDGKYKVRGLARDASKVKDLADKGVEIISGNANQTEDLKKLFHGAHAAFGLTFFWDPSQMGKEYDAGKLQVDAAKQEGVEHFVFSTLANVEKISHGKYHVPHFTDKAKVEEYARAAGFKYTTFVAPSFYYQNFQQFFPPKVDETGTYVFSMPGYPQDKPLYAFDVDETGLGVVAALNNPTKWNGKVIPMVGTKASVAEFVESFAKATGKKAKYFQAPSGVGGQEIQQMLDWFAEFGYYGPNVDLNVTKEAGNFKTWEEWVKTSWK